jgi:hypothetical protein
MEKVPRELPDMTVKFKISPHLKEDNCFVIPAAEPPILHGKVVKPGRFARPAQGFAVHGKKPAQYPVSLKQRVDQSMGGGMAELSEIG